MVLKAQTVRNWKLLTGFITVGTGFHAVFRIDYGPHDHCFRGVSHVHASYDHLHVEHDDLWCACHGLWERRRRFCTHATALLAFRHPCDVLHTAGPLLQ